MPTNLYESLIIAGFGGQGVIVSGKLLGQTAMKAGYEITFMPSYGAEVRGGTSNCMVTVSDQTIASPLISDPTTIIVLNQASYDRFAPKVHQGGLVIINSNKASDTLKLQGIDVIGVPVDDIAVELGSAKSANMVALGAYLAKRNHLTPQQLVNALPDILSERHHHTLPLNEAAVKAGYDFVKSFYDNR